MELNGEDFADEEFFFWQREGKKGEAVTEVLLWRIGIVLGDFEVQGLALESLAANINGEYRDDDVACVLGNKIDGVGSGGGHAIRREDRIDG